MGTLVRNAVLNFLTRSMQAGNKIESIVKRAVEFFDHAEILSAKEKLITLANEIGYDYVYRKTANDSDNVMEMAKILALCAKEKKPLPTFVIFDPQEVPTCPDEVSACVRIKVNEMCRKFDAGLGAIADKIKLASEQCAQQLAGVSQQCTTISDAISQGSPTPRSAANPPSKPLYSVVVKANDMPPELTSPQSRKDFFAKVCPSDVSSDSLTLKRSNDEWKILVQSRDAATQLAEAMKRKNITTKVKVPQFVGIMKRVPSSVSESELCQIAGCDKVAQCGSTRAFKLFYASRQTLENAIANPLKICLELFRIEEFRFLPRRCFKCHAVGHLAADCSQPERCSRCGGDGHSSSKDNPCSNPQKCLNCGSSRHSCYHAACPFNKAQPNTST